MSDSGGIKLGWYTGTVFQHRADDRLSNSLRRDVPVWAPMVVIGPVEPDEGFSDTSQGASELPAPRQSGFFNGCDLS